MGLDRAVLRASTKISHGRGGIPREMLPHAIAVKKQPHPIVRSWAKIIIHQKHMDRETQRQMWDKHVLRALPRRAELGPITNGTELTKGQRAVKLKDELDSI